MDALQRSAVRGSVEAWNQLDKARRILQDLWQNRFVDQDVLLSIVEDIQTEQDRLVRPPGG